jgi:hypothetical protein
MTRFCCILASASTEAAFFTRVCSLRLRDEYPAPGFAQQTFAGRAVICSNALPVGGRNTDHPFNRCMPARGRYKRPLANFACFSEPGWLIYWQIRNDEDAGYDLTL